jgi:hypothetical protein
MWMEKDFGNWLAGFIDGEGCFLIAYRKDRNAWTCQFRIRVREDDEEIIREIHQKTNIGRFFTHNIDKPTPPLACWEVSSKADCLRLVKLLDRYPLRAKKARDYIIWREAVMAWCDVKKGGEVKPDNSAIWSKISALSINLKEGRKYAFI